MGSRRGGARERRHRVQCLWCVAVAQLGLLLGACGGHSQGGGSSVTTERSELMGRLRSSLPSTSASSGQELINCVLHQAERLPIDQLRGVVDQRLGNPVYTRIASGCVRQGYGIQAFRDEIEDAVLRTPQSPLRACVKSGVASIPTPTLAQALATAINSGPGQFDPSRLLAPTTIRCLNRPALYAQWRPLVIRQLTASVPASEPTAFRTCVREILSHLSKPALENEALKAPSTALERQASACAAK
jgi:hypothetical protein